MKLEGLYQDGSVIARGSFGTVYIVPFESGVAAVVSLAGSLKFLSKERFIKLVNVDKTLSLENFELADIEALATETVLNNNFSIQGGWNLTTGAADGVYTAYTKVFSGAYIQTAEMMADSTQKALLVGAIAGLVHQRVQQHNSLQYIGLRKVWNDLTGL